jgi:hypothetical protein
MLCPSCRSEFVEGIHLCPDCQVDLIQELSEQASEEVPLTRDLVTLVETGNPFDVAVAESLLTEAEIPYWKQGDGLQDLFGGGRLGLGYNLLTGPVRIQVERQDLDQARKLLEPPAEAEPA